MFAAIFPSPPPSSPPPLLLRKFCRASWCQLVLPSADRRLRLGLKAHSSALCCPAAGLNVLKGIREQEVITFSVCYDLNRGDGGRLIRRRGWRSRGEETCVTFNSYIISNRSDAPRRVSPPFIKPAPHQYPEDFLTVWQILLPSLSLSLSLSPPNHITTVPENWIAFLGAVPASEMDLMCRNTWQLFFPSPFLWNLAWKSMLKIFYTSCRLCVCEGGVCSWVNQVDVFLISFRTSSVIPSCLFAGRLSVHLEGGCLLFTRL